MSAAALYHRACQDCAAELPPSCSASTQYCAACRAARDKASRKRANKRAMAKRVAARKAAGETYHWPRSERRPHACQRCGGPRPKGAHYCEECRKIKRAETKRQYAQSNRERGNADSRRNSAERRRRRELAAIARLAAQHEPPAAP